MKALLSLIIILVTVGQSMAQEKVQILSTDQFASHDRLFLAPLDGWIFKKGQVMNGHKLGLDVSDWQAFNPTQLSTDLEEENGRIEGWYRIKIKLDESFEDIPLGISRNLWAASDVYINGEHIHSFGDTGNPYEAYNPILKYPIPIELESGQEYLIAIHVVDYETTFTQREIRLKPRNLQQFINLTGPEYIEWVTNDIKLTHIYGTLTIAICFLLFFLFWLLVYLNPTQKVFRLIAWLTTFTFLASIGTYYNTYYEITYPVEKLRFVLTITLQPLSTLFGLLILEWVLTERISRLANWILALSLITNLPAHLFSFSIPFGIVFTTMILYFSYLVYTHRSSIGGARLTIVASMIVPAITATVWITIHKYSLDLFYEYDKPLSAMLNLGAPLLLLVYISVRFRELINEVSEEAAKVLKVTEEKKAILEDQNVVLEKQVSERTMELKASLEDLKSTQTQLIHSEKMASLGELTAGIAHEIQNPLNFVNNFSDLNRELIDEQLEELDNGEIEEAKAIARDIKENEGKINHHGKRAEEIVKSMLQHSRSGNGEKERTDINQLADEYLRLAYHGYRAKDKSFQSDFKLELDPALPKVSVVPQDIGRVLLNLINNAFQAVSAEASAKAGSDYKPEVVISTKYLPLPESSDRPSKGGTPLPGGAGGGSIAITVTDNGPGIPDGIKDKIFQPFFTTKPTGEGTGLGLSMSYDIVTKGHRGQLNMKSEKGKGTEFIVRLPVG